MVTWVDASNMARLAAAPVEMSIIRALFWGIRFEMVTEISAPLSRFVIVTSWPMGRIA
jgi:hypothetical protein